MAGLVSVGVSAFGPSGNLAWLFAAPVIWFSSALAISGGLSVGLLLLPIGLILSGLGLLHLPAADLEATAHVAAIPATVGALIGRHLGARADGRLSFGRSRLAIVAGLSALAVPVAAVTAFGIDLPDRALSAAYAIIGLVVSMLVFVLVLAQGSIHERQEALRVARFDWRMILVIAIVGGYLVGHVPFGISEILLVFLVLRGFAPGFAAGAALAAGLPAAIAALPALILRHHIDFQLLSAIVPAAFSGSFAFAWWMRRANPLIGANATALVVMSANLIIIVLALRS
jgi:uncharacterized membrane protein YfcA